LSRPFQTALIAVFFSTLITGIANADSVTPATPTSATVLQNGADRLSETVRIAPPVEPSADADLVMWSEAPDVAATPAERRHATASPPANAADARRNDTMHRLARGIVSRTSSIAMSLTRSAMRFIGTPYVFGGTSTSGFDCSGYTQHVFAMLGISLPRTADAQYFAGHRTVGGMTTGDLVFFETYEPGPSHVGIYVGSGKFIHSSSHGVMVSRLADGYWRSRYIGAKRIVAMR